MLARFVFQGGASVAAATARWPFPQQRNQIGSRRELLAKNVARLERAAVDQIDRGELLAPFDLRASELEYAVDGAYEDAFLLHADEPRSAPTRARVEPRLGDLE